jgi:CPA2 family monovalent cation:H+ antiporter-2
MEDSDLFLQVLLVAIAALLGGGIAQALRIPTIIGFLLAGVAIGPNTPGFTGDIDDVARAADVGVILLMFGIGIQLSFRQIAPYRRMILLGGGLQIVTSMILGVVIGLLLGLSWEAALVIGFFIPHTSTVVSGKVLERRGEQLSAHSIAGVNISILQDLSSVLMVIVILSLAEGGFATVDLGLAVLKGLALIGMTFVISIYILPSVWRWIALARSRELSLLSALTLAVGLATGSALLGLSIAFGAFLAGLALSENEYGHATLADIFPLREIFASVFFVSMGMLIEPAVLWEDPGTVAALAIAVVAGKGILTFLSVRVAGLTMQSAVMTALVIAQVGEFSFVISRTALDEGVISADLGSAFLMAAVLSIIVNPGILNLGPAIIGLLGRIPVFADETFEEPMVQQADEIETMNRHIIVGGYGEASAALVRSLAGRSLPFVVVDNNPFIYERVRKQEPELPFIFGELSRPEVLAAARAGQARAMVITFPNQIEAQIATQNALSMQPRLDIVARGSGEAHRFLRRAGVSEVVDPEFEAGLEFVRHVLRRFGLDGREITAIQTQMRGQFYRPE